MKLTQNAALSLILWTSIASAEPLLPAPDFFQLDPGPWGEIEARVIKISPPAAMVRRGFDLDELKENLWAFAEPTLEQVGQRLVLAGFNQNQIQQLLAGDRIRRHPIEDLWIIRPTSEAILALSPAQRANFYAPMRRLPAWDYASMVRKPTPIENSDPATWFSGVGLSQETIDLTKRLSFQQGRTTVLADVGFIFSQIEDEAEQEAFLRAIELTEAVVLRLKLTPNSDVRSLAKYWSNPESEASVRAMLEASRPQIGHRWIDLAQLLPPMPRSRLYTFAQDVDVHLSLPDCRWTALNFFTEVPSDRLADEDTAFGYLNENYDLVLPPYRFGDVIVVFEKGTGEFIHACTYIAANIVFTKNGKSVLNPWIFQTDERLSRLYVKDRVIEMRVMRRKPKDS